MSLIKQLFPTTSCSDDLWIFLHYGAQAKREKMPLKCQYHHSKLVRLYT